MDNNKVTGLVSDNKKLEITTGRLLLSFKYFKSVKRADVGTTLVRYICFSL